MIRGIIFEGIPGSGKTTLRGHLLRMIADRGCSILSLDESHTERCLEPLRSATVEDSLRLLAGIPELLKNFKILPCKFNGNLLKFFILERFHLSHCVDIAGPDNFEFYHTIEDTMNALNTTVVLLTIRPESILERSVMRTKLSRPASWTNYLSTLSKTDEGLADYYRIQQNLFLSLCEKTSLPFLQYDTTLENWPGLSAELLSTIFKPHPAT